MSVTEIKIEGIDTEAGIKRFAGKSEIYMKSLMKFATQYKEALIPSDADELKSFAHQIKGVAANLGINELSAVAAGTEKNPDDSPKFISLLNKTCEKILSNVNTSAPATEVNPKTAGSTEEYKSLISKLSVALKSCNYTQSKITSDELSAKEWPGIDIPDLKAIQSAVEKYDFDSAFALIEK